MLKRNDILWKGALEDFFIYFLRFIFKDADQIFDFSRGFVFLDKELATLFPGSDSEHPKFVDKLVKVFLKNGATKWILVHIEVQGYSQKGFARRMFTYFYRLLDKYNVPVTCVAIFLGNPSTNNATYFENEFLGTKVRFDFNSYYVGMQEEEVLLKDTNPFATIVLTALIALKHKKDMRQLFNSKITLARNLLRSGLSAEKTKRLLDFIRLYIHFEETELNISFDREIELLTDTKTKPMGITEQILDIAEKKGIAKGEKSGILKGEKRGELKAKRAIVKKSISLGLSQTTIAKITGLSIKEIRAI